MAYATGIAALTLALVVGGCAVRRWLHAARWEALTLINLLRSG